MAAAGDGLTITSIVGTKSRGVKIVDLLWSGTDEVGYVTIKRNETTLGDETPIDDNGAFRDNTGEKGGGTSTYQVCEQGTDNCDTADITF